jgi:putative oxidoreductase
MTISTVLPIAGRVLLALLFVLAGISKIIGPKPVLEHMQQEGVPRVLFPAVIALEIAVGGALLIGWHTQIAAGILAIFCIATAVVFHRNFKERTERAHFFKDIALAGALTILSSI